MWTARWIWHTRYRAEGVWWAGMRPDPQAANVFSLIRKGFAWEGAGPVLGRVTADSRYVLYVNGREVCRGPGRSAPAHLMVDTVDLTPHLSEGDNAVAALCRFYGHATVWWRPAVPAGQLGMGSFLFQAAGPGFALHSDRTWKARPGPYQREVPQNPVNAPPAEMIDLRQLPEGWTEAGFDDSSWDDAVELRALGPGQARMEPPLDPYPFLRPSPLPPMAETLIEPADLGGGVWDLGRLSVGLVSMDIDLAEGEAAEINGGEDLGPDGRPIVAPRFWNMTAIGRGGRATVEAFEPVGLRYLYAPSVSKVRFRERHFPRPDGPFFECSDEVLTRTWQVGTRTLDLCSTDAYVDCPNREQRAWLGDAYVHATTSLACNPDIRLVLRHLDLCADDTRSDGLLPMAAASDLGGVPQTIPDYSLHWVRTLARAVEFTGDNDLAARLLPTAQRVAAYFESFVQSDGLLHDVPGWVFVDWAQTERGSCMSFLNALYVLALDDMCAMQNRIGGGLVADQLTARAERTRSALSAFWDDGRGAVVDVLGGRRMSQQSNVMCILARGAPVTVLERVMDPTRLVITATPADQSGTGIASQFEAPENFDDEDQVVAAQPFFRHFVHQALAQAGWWDMLVALCRDWEHQLDSGTLWEYWHMEPGTGSRCHAWSTTAVHDLARHVLGVKVVDAEASVESHLGGLEWARGAIPTPKGLVEVALP